MTDTETPTRANYAVMSVQEHLGDSPDGLGVPWAEYAGTHRSSEFTFTIPRTPAEEPYVELQAFDVGDYGHEIVVNGDALTGFDVPPADGWQFWMDTITGAQLVEGENTLRFVRDASTDDGFAIGSVVVHWKEPV